MSPLIVCIVVFIGVSALVIGISFVMRGDKEAEIEDRLSVLTGGKKKSRSKADAAQYAELLATMRGEGTSSIEKLISRYMNLRAAVRAGRRGIARAAVPDHLRRSWLRSALWRPRRRA